MTDPIRDYWDGQAASFDDEPDHGLREPSVRIAWSSVVLPFMPPAPASLTDLGCRAGTLSVLLARAGYDVRGVDLSDRMVAAAVAKADTAEVPVEFRQGDAASPPYAPASTDVVIARHVLWPLPDPVAALRQWLALLRPEGRLVLIEGRWMTGVGIPAAQCRSLVLQHRREALVRNLDDPALAACSMPRA